MKVERWSCLLEGISYLILLVFILGALANVFRLADVYQYQWETRVVVSLIYQGLRTVALGVLLCCLARVGALVLRILARGRCRDE